MAMLIIMAVLITKAMIGHRVILVNHILRIGIDRDRSL
jgi:hypothetical protein